MERDLSLLIKESLHEIFDAYKRANAIGWRAVRGPEDEEWQVVEGNVD